MKRIIKKIVLFPVKIVIILLKLTVNIIIEVESLAIGLLMTVMGVCFLICIWQKMWDSLRGFLIIGAVVFVIMFITALAGAIIESIEAAISDV